MSLLKLSHDPEIHTAIIRMCSRYSASVAVIDSLHKAGGLPDMAACLELAKQNENDKVT